MKISSPTRTDRYQSLYRDNTLRRLSELSSDVLVDLAKRAGMVDILQEA